MQPWSLAADFMFSKISLVRIMACFERAAMCKGSDFTAFLMYLLHLSQDENLWFIIFSVMKKESKPRNGIRSQLVGHDHPDQIDSGTRLPDQVNSGNPWNFLQCGMRGRYKFSLDPYQSGINTAQAKGT